MIDLSSAKTINNSSTTSNTIEKSPTNNTSSRISPTTAKYPSLPLSLQNFKINVFDFIPLTFIVDFSDDNCDYNVNLFLKAYESYMPESLKKNINEPIPKYMLEIKRKLRGHFTQGNYNYREYVTLILIHLQGIATKYRIGDTFIDGPDSKFLWLLKPTFLNRGRGIHVFEDLRNLVQLISEYQEGYIEKGFKKEEAEEDSK